MGIFVRAPLPGMIGMGNVDSGAQGRGDPFVFRSLRAIVQRERMHPVPEQTEEGHGRLPEGGGGPSRQGREQGIARAAFHGGDEDPLVPRPDQGIAFSVIRPPLAHSARQRSCTSKLNSPPYAVRR